MPREQERECGAPFVNLGVLRDSASHIWMAELCSTRLCSKSVRFSPACCRPWDPIRRARNGRTGRIQRRSVSIRDLLQQRQISGVVPGFGQIKCIVKRRGLRAQKRKNGHPPAQQRGPARADEVRRKMRETGFLVQHRQTNLLKIALIDRDCTGERGRERGCKDKQYTTPLGRTPSGKGHRCIPHLTPQYISPHPHF